MNFKSKKTSVIAVLVILAAVQFIFAGVNKDDRRNVRAAFQTETEDMHADMNLLCAQDEDAEVTEEVISADLNVVYRSTLTSTEGAGVFRNEDNESDFDGKLVSYTSERLCVYSEPDLASEVVGVRYSGTVADIVEAGYEWTRIKSGEVE